MKGEKAKRVTQSLTRKLNWTRRRFLLFTGYAALLQAISTACRTNQMTKEIEAVMSESTQKAEDAKAPQEGRLTARPAKHVSQKVQPGTHSLKIESKREALLYIPAGFKGERPAPFALMLHGAGGNTHHGIALLQHFADESGIVLLAPKSLHGTWDVIADEYGVDVEFINRALEQVFDSCLIDPKRFAVGGFSDGASYALSLGIINGNLFTHIIAFSPGFMAPTMQQGVPRVFISHGTEDRVLPIERCSRRIVPQLKRGGYDVTYREFDGPHMIPPEIARESVEWFTTKPH